jgi:hypothetical protein
MSSDEDSNKPISFRPRKGLTETLKTYKGIHKCKDMTETINKILQEWQELTQKTQNPTSQTMTETADPIIEKWRKDYEKKYVLTLAEGKAKTDIMVDRAEKISKVKVETEGLVSQERFERKKSLAGISFRGPKVDYPEAGGPVFVPDAPRKNWNAYLDECRRAKLNEGPPPS